MDKSRALTMYYFSIDGRNGLAKIYEGLLVETDEDLETFLRSVAVAVTADIERLFYTYRQDIPLKDKLACLLSLQNIIDSDFKVFSCNGDGVEIRRDVVSVKEMFDEYVLHITDGAPDEFKVHFDEIQSFLSTIERKIKSLQSIIRKEEIGDKGRDEQRIHFLRKEEK